MKPVRTTVAVLLVLALAGAACTEKPQTLGRKADTPASQGAANPFVAEGWKPGDAASWERQIKNRAQHGQNEYSRASGPT
jgi:hypothetical protein